MIKRLSTTVFLLAFLTTGVQPQSGDGAVFSGNAVLQDGLKLAKKKKFDRAVMSFEQAVQSWQTHATARLYLRIIDDAEHKVIKKNTARDIFKGIYEDYQANYEKALKILDKVSRKNKTYMPLLLVKGQVLGELEKTDEAEEVFARAVASAEQDPLPYLFRGKFFVDLQRYDEAVKDYDQAVTLSPEAIFFFERGFALTLQKKYSKAISDFEQVAKKQPKWAKSSVVNEAYYNRGSYYIQKKAFRKAVRDFTYAIAIDSSYFDSYVNRGIAYRNLKQFSKASADFSYVIARSDQPREAYYQRGQMQYDRGRYRQAIGDLSKALEYRPNDPQMLFKLAECHYKLGQNQKAIAYFDRVIKRSPQFFWAYYWKGYACRDARKNKLALQAFKQFLSLAPKRYYKQIAHAEVEIKKLQRRM